MTVFRALAIVGPLLALLAGCAELQSAHQSQEFGKYLRELHIVTGPCLRASQESNDYLLKVCEYVVNNKVEVTSHPNTWKIIRVADETIEGKPGLAVHLSCCGPGDTAFFDKSTGEIYAYARKRW
jgi:hypothetical protein